MSVMAGPKRDVASIIKTCAGSILTETIGVCEEREACTGPFVVLYQRGLLSNPRTVERSHQNLLSAFKIKCTGFGMAAQPYAPCAIFFLEASIPSTQRSLKCTGSPETLDILLNFDTKISQHVKVLR